MSDRATLVKFVREYQAKFSPGTSIDTLLTRPIEAMKLGLFVAAKQQRISQTLGLKVAKVIDRLNKAEPRALAAMDEVLHDALNARKRGEFKVRTKA